MSNRQQHSDDTNSTINISHQRYHSHPEQQYRRRAMLQQQIVTTQAVSDVKADTLSNTLPRNHHQKQQFPSPQHFTNRISLHTGGSVSPSSNFSSSQRRMTTGGTSMQPIVMSAMMRQRGSALVMSFLF
jgi:hypothetical protein